MKATGIIDGKPKARNHQRFGSDAGEGCREGGESNDITFESEHEIVQRVLVLPVRLRIVLLYIIVDGSLYEFYSTLSKVGYTK